MTCRSQKRRYRGLEIKVCSVLRPSKLTIPPSCPLAHRRAEFVDPRIDFLVQEYQQNASLGDVLLEEMRTRLCHPA